MASMPLPDAGEVLQARGFITTPNGVEKMAQSLGAGAARKVLFKWLGIGILGGTAFDHVLFSLPLPYLHSDTNIRAVQEDGGMSPLV
ncbi:unnamed protein product [Tilletia laevis]|nr:unnamed protein product [Tilletia controversa]CAD6965597.1 unnamed protein product [Tilletia laevis]CAD6968576.1 unnamed protein product [Tilletia controversa]